MLQIGMDGPNVNFKALSDIKKEIHSTYGNELLEIGSCGLHVIHGAFKMSFEKNDWDVASYLQSLYYAFEKSPTQRSLFVQYTGSSKFPDHFCGTRWVENAKVAHNAIKSLPNIKLFIEKSKEN